MTFNFNVISGVKTDNTPEEVAVDVDGRLIINAEGETLTEIRDRLPTGTVTPTLQRITTSTTIAAGSLSIAIANAGESNATVLGATLKPGESISFETPGNCTLGAIEVNGTGTELIVARVVAA
jgi:hypothetical protein